MRDDQGNGAGQQPDDAEQEMNTPGQDRYAGQEIRQPGELGQSHEDRSIVPGFDRSDVSGSPADQPSHLAHPGEPPSAPGQPGYGQPAYSQPDYSQPGHHQPGYHQPGYGQPFYPAPGDHGGPTVPGGAGGPGYPPAPGQPYGQPQYRQPQYGQAPYRHAPYGYGRAYRPPGFLPPPTTAARPR